MDRNQRLPETGSGGEGIDYKGHGGALRMIEIFCILIAVVAT